MAKGFQHAPRFEFHDTSADINPTIFILVYVDDIITTGRLSSLTTQSKHTRDLHKNQLG